MTKNRITFSSVAKWVLILLIAATLTFIFTNSLKSQEQSLEDSGAVGGLLSTIFPPETPLGSFIKENVRKIAHFVEYGVLGAEVAVYICCFTDKRMMYAAFGCAAAFFVGFIDETLQYVSDRGPSISDVWVDASGFWAFSAVVYGVFALAYLIKSKKCSAKDAAGEGGQNGKDNRS